MPRRPWQECRVKSRSGSERSAGPVEQQQQGRRTDGSPTGDPRIRGSLGRPQLDRTRCCARPEAEPRRWRGPSGVEQQRLTLDAPIASPAFHDRTGTVELGTASRIARIARPLTARTSARMSEPPANTRLPRKASFPGTAGGVPRRERSGSRPRRPVHGAAASRERGGRAALLRLDQLSILSQSAPAS
jgi:hypothetical protein